MAVSSARVSRASPQMANTQPEYVPKPIHDSTHAYLHDQQRGGAGNIGGVAGERHSEDKVPKESEVKPQDDFHTGVCPSH